MTEAEHVEDIPQEKTTASVVASLAANRKKIESKKIAEKRAAKAEELLDKFKEGQLVLWSDDERGMPSELVRCALFSAKNRKEPRAIYLAADPLIFPLIGKGQIRFRGEELRQDDETVWMQLVHISKEMRSEWIDVRPHSLLKAMRWPIKGDSYKRLAISIRRLNSNSIDVYSDRYDRSVNTSLIKEAHISEKNMDLPWRIQVFAKDSLLSLLFDNLYSRVDWETRLSLPTGVATWLHSFFASHRDPFPHKVETLAQGAGILLETKEDTELNPAQLQAKRKRRLREARRLLIKALEELKKLEFLEDFQVSPKGLVTVRRKGDSRPIL